MNGTYSTPELEPYLVLAQELMRHVYAEEAPAEVQTWLLAQLGKLSCAAPTNALMTWAESFDVYAQVLAHRVALSALPESERKQLSWPWASWNKLLDPLEPGLLLTLAAADGGGKTLYAECIAEHWAKMGRQVVYLHFELNRAVMLDRRAARHTGIERRTLLNGVLSPYQEVLRAEADARLKAFAGCITYLHTPGWTVEQALAQLRGLIEAKQCDVFIVDYLEKAIPSPRQLKTYGSNETSREADDVEQIKSFSETTEIPALMVAQLNKLGKGRAFSDLTRADIRGAGAKTEKANIAVLLHHDEGNPEVNVKIDKNTMGPTGSFKQYMNGARFLVADIV